MKLWRLRGLKITHSSTITTSLERKKYVVSKSISRGKSLSSTSLGSKTLLRTARDKHQQPSKKSVQFFLLFIKGTNINYFIFTNDNNIFFSIFTIPSSSRKRKALKMKMNFLTDIRRLKEVGKKLFLICTEKWWKIKPAPWNY